MSRRHIAKLGSIPSAAGTLTRLAYTRVKTGGLDPRPFLKSANLTLQQIKNPHLRLNVKDQIRFLNFIAGALRDELFGFHLALSSDLREFGVLYYIAASSERLSEALQRLARYASIANEGVSLRYLSGRTPGLTIRYVGVSRHIDRHQIEFFMTMLVRLFRHLTGNRLVPTGIKFSHRREGGDRELTRFFGSDVEFSSHVDEVLFTQTDFDMPITSRDPYLNRLLVTQGEEALKRRRVKRGSFRTAVENAILPLLPHGKANLDEIARRLGISQRTLERRLSREKLTFSTVLGELKTDLSKRYLAEDNLSISQVAWLLGYQQVSSFTHAFKRWSGKSPRQARLRSVAKAS
ncbi:MAG TPA: AraC family transcriptional regulator [Pseudolabrys sp.]|nr:AraC family transcriptional regulator [Pseudolabrys sp.]